MQSDWADEKAKTIIFFWSDEMEADEQAELGSVIAHNLREAYEAALDDAIHAVVCTPKYPASDHDAHIRAADAIRALRPNAQLLSEGKKTV